MFIYLQDVARSEGNCSELHAEGGTEQRPARTVFLHREHGGRQPSQCQEPGRVLACY